MIRQREEFLNRGSYVIYFEERRRRRRNIKTCCVSLEMAMVVFLKTWCTPSNCVSFSFVFLCFFFFFLRFRFKGKQGTVRNGLITVLRTVRSDRGSHGSLHFSHRVVLETKRTAKMNDSRFSRLDRTVRSRFQNLGDNKCDPIYNFFFFC